MPSNVCNPRLPIPRDCHGYSCSLHQRLLPASSAELLRIAQALSQAQEGELQGRMESLQAQGKRGWGDRTGQCGSQLMDVQQHVLLSAIRLAGAGVRLPKCSQLPGMRGEVRLRWDTGKKLQEQKKQLWNRVPREVVAAPSLEVSKARLDREHSPRQAQSGFLCEYSLKMRKQKSLAENKGKPSRNTMIGKNTPQTRSRFKNVHLQVCS